MTVYFGQAEPAKFRCRHEHPADISWQVNGMPFAIYPGLITGSVIEDGLLVRILSVPAWPEYNGTMVVCLALFSSQLESSPSATLIVLAIAGPGMLFNHV